MKRRHFLTSTTAAAPGRIAPTDKLRIAAKAFGKFANAERFMDLQVSPTLQNNWQIR